MKYYYTNNMNYLIILILARQSSTNYLHMKQFFGPPLFSEIVQYNPINSLQDFHIGTFKGHLISTVYKINVKGIFLR